MPEKPPEKPAEELGLLAAPWQKLLSGVLARIGGYLWDIGGVLGFALALILLLALVGLTKGVLLTPLVTFCRRWLGWGSYFLVLGLGVGGWMMFRRRAGELPPIRWGRVLSFELVVFALLALLALSGGTSIERAEAGLDGGLIGWGLAEGVRLVFGRFWSWVIVIFACVGGLILWLRKPGIIPGWVRWRMASLETMPGAEVAEPVVSVAPVVGQKQAKKSDRFSDKKKQMKIPPEFRKQFRVADNASGAPPPARDERLPPLTLLSEQVDYLPDERHINLIAGLIEKTLAEFGIPAKVVGFRVGPTVTQFALEPGYTERQTVEGEVQKQKVRVSQISALSRDLALALSASRLRIQAPVPGEPYVGVEVPNVKSSNVRLRPILESEAFYKLGSPLSIALGLDVSGRQVFADLAQMPHLLIAGTTGSGKSVCIAAMAICLVMNNTPQDLRLVMIDPKKVELVRFNGLPHLYGKVETDLERNLGVLRWTVVEMERRYLLLEEMRARNIQSYNRKIRRRKDGEHLARVVVFVDELADLMLIAPEQTENTLVRLAQKARATGIHLVIATQRPSTEVVTGLIKANFPARISFAVASSVDSRVILDVPGAEHLLGRGDMLFMPPEVGVPIRTQGVMVSDEEIEGVIKYWQGVELELEARPPWEEMLEEETGLAEEDALLAEAIKLIQQTQTASASFLQRRLRVGYPRAARLIDELMELGYIGPSRSGGRGHEVLIEPEEEEDKD
ncbi:MAG: DNA translocase FtsK [Chloroflexota bacterium]